MLDWRLKYWMFAEVIDDGVDDSMQHPHQVFILQLVGPAVHFLVNLFWIIEPQGHDGILSVAKLKDELCKG